MKNQIMLKISIFTLLILAPVKILAEGEDLIYNNTMNVILEGGQITNKESGYTFTRGVMKNEGTGKLFKGDMNIKYAPYNYNGKTFYPSPYIRDRYGKTSINPYITVQFGMYEKNPVEGEEVGLDAYLSDASKLNSQTLLRETNRSDFICLQGDVDGYCPEPNNDLDYYSTAFLKYDEWHKTDQIMGDGFKTEQIISGTVNAIAVKIAELEDSILKLEVMLDELRNETVELEEERDRISEEYQKQELNYASLLKTAETLEGTIDDKTKEETSVIGIDEGYTQTMEALIEDKINYESLLGTYIQQQEVITALTLELMTSKSDLENANIEDSVNEKVGDMDTEDINVAAVISEYLEAYNNDIRTSPTYIKKISATAGVSNAGKEVEAGTSMGFDLMGSQFKETEEIR